MYHSIVKAIIVRAFRHVDRGDYEPIVAMMAAPACEHTFVGDHALGGTRRSQAAIRQWGQRLFRLFPGIRFHLSTLVVSGWPWRTRAAVEWTEANAGADGIPSSNRGVHLLELRWGRVRRLVIFTDTARLQGNLLRLAAAGVAEAAQPPIVDGADTPEGLTEARW
jgi:ketosteroid isomerase-like protein